MAPETKRRKVDFAPPPRRTAPSAAEKCTAIASTNRSTLSVDAGQTRDVNLKIQHAKNYAVAQAQQEGCTSNFRIFDSSFGNFLVPVIPTPAELGG